MRAKTWAMAGLSVGAALAFGSPAGADSAPYHQTAGDADLAYGCYLRSYDNAHLAAHPLQNVTRMTALAYRSGPAATAEHVLNLAIRFRAGGPDSEFPGVCRAMGAGAWACSVECDGGSFTIKPSGAASIRIDLGAGVGGCDAELLDEKAFGSDDQVFRLDPAAAEDCRDLIWDDEKKSSLLKAFAVGR